MREFVGKTFFVEWPYLREAYIKSVSDKNGSITAMSEGIKTKPFDKDESSKWQKEAAFEQSRWLTSWGLDIGEVEVILSMIPISGMVMTQLGSAKKRFEGTETRCPLQLAAAAPTENDPRFMERDTVKPEELFPLGSKVMSLRVPLRGKLGVVMGHHSASGMVDVEFHLTLSEKLLQRSLQRPRIRKKKTGAEADILFVFFGPLASGGGAAGSP